MSGEETGPYPSAKRRKPLGGGGEPVVFVADEQSEHPVDTARWSRLAEAVLRQEGVEVDAELSLLFVDETAMSELHERFLGERGPTDVLSFPLDGEDVAWSHHDPATTGPDRPEPTDDPLLLLGDVVICPAVAARNAPTHAGTYDDELALLVVHGVLHVLGNDHDDEASTARMRERERALLEAHHWAGPAPAGFRQEQP